MKKFKLLMTMITAFCLLSVTSALPAIAANKDLACEGVGIASGGRGCVDPPGSPNVGTVVERVIDILSIIVGIVAVIMIIIGGFKYIISSGDSANINSAKNTILYAVVGLVVVALAQVIVRFVLNSI